jgi:large subunit ribosomal protein L3
MAPRLPLRCWAPLERPVLRSETPLLLRSPTSPLQHITQQKRGKRYGWSTLPRRSPRPEKYNSQTPGLPVPTSGPAAAQARRENTTPVRTGVLAIKKGMTAFYTRKGRRIPATVLQLDAVQVVAVRTWERDRRWAVQVGLGTRQPDNLTAPQLGYFEAKGIAPKEHLADFPVRSEAGLLPVGVELRPDWFYVGQWVDVRSRSRGQGFAGGMKRHGFAGQPASHGASLVHRAIGSAGPSQGGGSRVLPGKKMPGRMGNEKVTVQNLAVLQVDNEMGIVLVKGAVGGPKGCMVKIRDAIKKPLPPQEFVDKSRELVLRRTPNAEQALRKARAMHMELKQIRKEGRIKEVLSGELTVSGTAEQAAASL